MAKILIVEDEPAMQLGLRDNLEFEGYVVEVAGDGEAGLTKIRSNGYDLILLDIMLPKISGLDVCKKARSENITTPIILLTAKGEEIDKILGLELGADDYVTKPFSLRELLARIKAILRRSGESSATADDETISIGQLSVNFTKYIATDAEGDVKLSHKEFEILHFLYTHKNEPVSRYRLLEEVWGYDDDAQPTTRTVDNFILRLRQRVEKDPKEPHIILTVHGSGYKMVLR
jgi:DNA-binding response OmpR family regulator